ncbi:MAG: large conductance mechanosensitive channel protein MscL [Clostridia bacterium]|nr:large conductance mechanosensitive channel protein MscL [Clostridia bacterium]
MKKFWQDFKKFISRGNIVDMAVGVIVGGAFSAIVTSLTNQIIRPVINWILSMCTGGDGLSSVFTFLKKVYIVDATTGEKTVDLANSIYIDWGAFITKIIDFLIIAFTIFVMIKIIAKSQEVINKTAKSIEKGIPDKAERKILKQRGVNLKDPKAVREALIQLDEEKKQEEERKKAEEAAKPKPETDLDVLKEIRELLKAQAVKDAVQDSAVEIPVETTDTTEAK